MYNVHLFVDRELVAKPRLLHLPAVGDIIRRAVDSYSRVTEIVWCFDEDHLNSTHQRVNIATEKLL